VSAALQAQAGPAGVAPGVRGQVPAAPLLTLRGVHTHIVAPMAASASDVQRTFAAFAGDRFTLR